MYSAVYDVNYIKLTLTYNFSMELPKADFYVRFGFQSLFQKWYVEHFLHERYTALLKNPLAELPEILGNLLHFDAVWFALIPSQIFIGIPGKCASLFSACMAIKNSRKLHIFQVDMYISCLLLFGMAWLWNMYIFWIRKLSKQKCSMSGIN